MKSQLSIAMLVVTALSVGATAKHHETKNNVLSDKEKKEGWKLLFDGKTMNGWNTWRTKKAVATDKWVVKDGMMTLTKGGGDIYTAEPYENYELYLEWKTQGNSGILIRVDPSTKGPIYGVAPEVQIIPDGPKSLKSTSAGGLYALYEMKVKEKKINPKGWNSVRIRLVDGKGTHWFNGLKVYEYQIGSDEWKARVKTSKFKKKVDTFGMTAKGHIGLQDHGQSVSFRNVKIRVLESDKKKG